MIKQEETYIIEENKSTFTKRKNSKMLTKKQMKLLRQTLSVFLILFLIGIWLIISFKGIEFGKQYIDDAMGNLEAKNNANYQALLVENAALNLEIKKLNEEISQFKSDVTTLNENIDVFGIEVAALKSSIDFIDTSVSNSITIQEDIGNKILSLDARIQALKKSLNVLLEAP